MSGRSGHRALTRRNFVKAAVATPLGALLPAPSSADETNSSILAVQRTAPKLRWPPPAQNDARIVEISSGFFSSPEFGEEEDVVVKLPGIAMRDGADVQINGGRHVRIIGGHMRGRLMWRNGSGSLFVEGVLIDLNTVPNRDAITVSGASSSPPDIYLQNIIVTGVQGTFAGVHADVFQAYGPIGRLRVHSMTADSNYQGFFIRPEFSIAGATFSRVNMKFNKRGKPEGGTFLFWCRNMQGSPAKGDAFYPVEFGPEVYAEPNARAADWPAAFPPPGILVPGKEGRNFDGAVGADNSIGWPEHSGITGRVLLGPPKDGDMVKPTDIGANYRSPGYDD